MTIWTPIPAITSHGRRSRMSARAVRRPRASGTVSTATRKTSPRIIKSRIGAREPRLAPTNVQSLRFGLLVTDECRESGFRNRTGSHDKEVIRHEGTPVPHRRDREHGRCPSRGARGQLQVDLGRLEVRPAPTDSAKEEDVTMKVRNGRKW